MDRLKGLTLALIVVLAMGALTAAGAGAAKLTAAAYPATLDGGPLVKTGFKIAGKQITCESTTFSAPTLEKATETLVIGRSYSGCSIGGLPVTFTMNGCAFELHIENVNAANVDIVCEGIAGIEVHVYANATDHAAGKSLCLYELIPQNGLKVVELANVAGGHVDITPNVKNISYKRLSGTMLLCGAATGSDGTYTGSTTVSGTNGGAKVNLEVK